MHEDDNAMDDPDIEIDAARRAKETECSRGAVLGHTGVPGYLLSQRKRKLIEEVRGWMKEVAGFRKCKLVGRRLVAHAANLVGVAFNLRRMATLLSAA